MLTDIFMIVLCINACREIDWISYVNFVCAFIYYVVKIMKHIKNK